MTELPQGPWQSIAIDFMCPLIYRLQTMFCFAVTDYFSRYVEVSITKKNTADVAINSLQKMFATHGLPYTVPSDKIPVAFLQIQGLFKEKVIFKDFSRNEQFFQENSRPIGTMAYHRPPNDHYLPLNLLF